MILLNRSYPEKSLYVIGAFLIEKLRQHTGSFSAVDLFEKYEVELSVSFPHFLLTLDWLFIAGLIKQTTDGKLEKCF